MMNDLVEKPQFTHVNCPQCKFLGVFDGCDLYACILSSDNTTIKTVVARYGSAGPDYISGLYFAKPESNFPHLQEALLRARSRGFKER